VHVISEDHLGGPPANIATHGTFELDDRRHGKNSTEHDDLMKLMYHYQMLYEYNISPQMC